MSDPLVAVIVLNYEGRDLLAKYLPSVTNLEYDNYRVVVVDNDSSDGSVEFLRSEFPDVTVVANDENVGFSRGNNVGAVAAPDADYYWFLNTDTSVEPDSLGTLVDHVESSPDTGIVVPRIDDADQPGVIQSLGYDFTVFGTPRAREHGDREPTRTDPHPVAYGSGSALLVDRDVWDEIGGFDDGNFIFGDDEYLCLRAWLHGYRVEVVPEAVVYHELGASRGEVAPTVAYHHGRSRARSYFKLLQPSSLLLGTPGFVVYALELAAADLLLRRSPKAALYRLAGFASPLLELPSLYAERRAVQREREVDDDRFLSTPWSTRP